MCGIAMLKRPYNHSMAHRGISTNEHVVDAGTRFRTMIHEHLPIQATIDDQPIIQTERYIIIFNGEIFNDHYENDLDYLYDVFNVGGSIDDIVHHIAGQDGFFAIIVYDRFTDSIYAFTDALGKKQLYISDIGIASEIRPLENKDNTVDPYHIAHTIKFGYAIDNSTPYNEVKRLMPNTLYHFDIDFQLMSSRPNLFEFCPDRSSDLYELMDKAVSNRLKGHLDVALLLSGGLDSSIIYHHIKEQGAKVTTYCVDNEDDLECARMLDPNVESVSLDYDSQALLAMEMPLDLGSLYPQFSLFAKVRHTVVLSGDGADELFGGYNRMQQYDSQHSDIFDELPFYHNVRNDRLSMWHTKEIRCPFMANSIVQYALGIPYKYRVNKAILREIYKDKLPEDIALRSKVPLKSTQVRAQDPTTYRSDLVSRWMILNNKYYI